MGPDPRFQGSSRSETRRMVAAIIHSFNETGNPPAARVQHAVAGPPWQNVHIRWKDDGSCVPSMRSPLARAPAPGTSANAPESVDHAHPPRPASPTPRDQRKRPREDVPALGDLPNGATKRKTNGQPSARVASRPLVVHRKTSFSEEWNPESDPRLGRIFRLRVDRDGNPRGEATFADDKYPLRWVRLVTTEHQLRGGNRPSGFYAACATEAKNWEAANRAFSRLEARATKNAKRNKIVFYESLDLEFLESKHDVEYLDLHRYPHPGAAGRVTPSSSVEEKEERDGSPEDDEPSADVRTTRTPHAEGEAPERRSDSGFLARLVDLAAAATAEGAPRGSRPAKEDEKEKDTPEAPGSPERVAASPTADARGDRAADLVETKQIAGRIKRAAAPAPAHTAGPIRPADPDSSRQRVLTAEPTELREEVRLLKMRLEHVDCRLRNERTERRVNETRLMAALRESRQALERVRAAVERDTVA